MPATAVLRTLEQAWSALQPLNLPTAVMGGLALSAWEYPRATRDVDLVIEIGQGSPDAVLLALQKAGFRAKRTPAIRQLGSMRILQMEYDPPDAFVSIPTDVLLVDSAYHHTALQRPVPYRLSDASSEIMVLACEDLILHKLLAGRVIDRSDAAALIRANRAALDVAYLRQWARELAVESELDEVWREACPDEPLPAS